MKEKIIERPAVCEDDDSLNKIHYDKQMDSVKRILYYKQQGFNCEDAARKIGLAPSYVSMVYGLGEDKMNNYWRKLHNAR